MTTSHHDAPPARFVGDGFPVVYAGYDQSTDVTGTLFDDGTDTPEAQGSVDGSAGAVEKTSPKTPSVIERVGILLSQHSFVPSSQRELTLARSMAKRFAVGKDLADLLEAVRAKQEDAGVSHPDNALHLIVDEMRWFESTSKGDVGQLGLLLGSLDMERGPVELHPQAYASSQPEFDKLDERHGVRRAISLVVKRAQIDHTLAEESGQAPDINLDDGVTAAEIDDYLNTHTVKETRAALLEERTAQRTRHDFWETVLRKGRRYALAKRVAKAATDQRGWPVDD